MNFPMIPSSEGQMYTHERAVQIAREWMIENYGSPKSMTVGESDIFHSKLGLLIDFLHTLHPPEK